MATAGKDMRRSKGLSDATKLSGATGGLSARASFFAGSGQREPAIPGATPAPFAGVLPGQGFVPATHNPQLVTRSVRPALAALEALLLLVIVTAGLSLLVGQAESSRAHLRQNLATRQIAVLREALSVYYLDTGTFPPGRPDAASGDVFKTLRSWPSCGTVLADWPQAAPAQTDAAPCDPWRIPYRYIAPENDRSQQIAGNGGWPFFLSAGPDGHFGDSASPAAEIDNRRTDELLAQ
jgi:type II secretory pathway pseudopilin PulG